jgi:Protein of unknown function (DUF4058)
MPVSFPGMNPYLEHPDLWPDVHRRFVTAFVDLLKNQLPSHYDVAIRKRIYRVSGDDALMVGHTDLTTPSISRTRSFETPTEVAFYRNSASNNSANSNGWNGNGANGNGANGNGANGNGSSQSVAVVAPAPRLMSQVNKPIPVYVPVPQDVQENYIEIIEPNAAEVVTVIDVLTPKKKRTGRGRDHYEHHRESILGSPAHFVEIDFLRGWEPLAIYGPDSESDYRILVSRSEQRPKADLYTWQVNDPIPYFALPLAHLGEDLAIDIKPALDKAYERSGYDMVIDYQRDPLPPLSAPEADWLDGFLQQIGLR